MVERLPKLEQVWQLGGSPYIVELYFDRQLTQAQLEELHSHVALKFAGQLRRDPDSPQTPPPPPEAES
jgi:hypothetical protein